ncbi:MAG: PLP-dependent aspartate aminotransferase family protein [Acidobacteriota bacterium]
MSQHSRDDRSRDTLSLGLGSLVIHGGQKPEPVTGAVVPPIFTAATYAQEAPGVHQGFEYSRSHNPTRYALERMIASLEGSTLTEDDDPSCGGFAFASGLAAMATLLELLDSGDKIVAMDDLYGGSRRLLSQVRERSQKLDVSYVDMTDLELSQDAIDSDTRMVWVETPTNPMLKLVDLKAIAEIARRANPDVLLVCDNTFSSPIFQRPLEHGFDLVMHSATKYLNGHSDVVGGLVVADRLDLVETLRFLQNAIGSVMGPFDASMTLRGIKTLDVRMQRHAENASRIAEWLGGHGRVAKVLFPALPSHPEYALYQRQMDGPGGMVTFVLDGDLEHASRLAGSLRVFQLAESLGAVESLVNHPAIMTHASVPAEVRAELGMSDSLLRLSVGIERVEDLLADLEEAFAAAFE